MKKAPIGGNALARNTIFNLLGQAIPIVVGFLTIPALIRMLEVDRYGLLTLVWTFIGYFTVFDMGLGRAIIRSVADKIGKDKLEEIPKVFWGSLTLLTFFSFIGAIVLALLAPYLIQTVFHIPSHLEEEGLYSLYVLTLAIPIVTFTAGVRGVLEADQRFAAINFLQAILGSLTFVAPFLTLYFSKSVFPIVIVLVTIRFFSLIGHLYLCLKHYPDLRKFRGIDKANLKEILQFGSWLTVSNVISPIMVYFDRFILGSVVHVAQLAYYSTPYEMVSRFLVIPSAVSRVLFPAFTRSIAEDQKHVLVLMDRGLKSVVIALFPVCLVVVFFAHEILSLWIGPEFALQSTTILQIFAIGILFNGVASIPFTLLQSADRPDITAKIHLFELPIYLGVIYFFATRYGGKGAAFAWSLRIVLDMYLLFFTMNKVLPETKERAKKFHQQIQVLVSGLVLSFLLSMWESPWRWFAFALVMIYFAVYIWGYTLSIQDRLAIIGLIKKQKTPDVNAALADKVCAVIVCYYPDDSVLENVKEISKQVDHVIIIDNGSPQEYQWIFRSIESEGHSVYYSPKNLGIAAALNLGIFHAQRKGFEWVATFDQDSCPHNNLIEIMAQTLKEHPAPHLVGLVSCTLLDRGSGRYLRQNLSKSWGEIITAITSGNLVRISAFEAVNGYDESMFIDYVDHDFCFRLLKGGYRVIEASEAVLSHSCGNPRSHKIFGWVYFSSHHNEVRRYYNTRNRFTVYRRAFYVELRWVIQDFWYFLKEVFKIVIAEDKKLIKLKFIFIGLFDSFCGHSGPFKSEPKS